MEKNPVIDIQLYPDGTTWSSKYAPAIGDLSTQNGHPVMYDGHEWVRVEMPRPKDEFFLNLRSANIPFDELDADGRRRCMEYLDVLLHLGIVTKYNEELCKEYFGTVTIDTLIRRIWSEGETVTSFTAQDLSAYRDVLLSSAAWRQIGGADIRINTANPLSWKASPTSQNSL